MCIIIDGLIRIFHLVINEVNQQTSICRVDISSVTRGINVPCSNDVSSVFTFNSNSLSSSAVTDLGVLCNIACQYECTLSRSDRSCLVYSLYLFLIIANGSNLNSSLSLDSDTVVIQVFFLATSQTSSTFDITLANLLPAGQSALPMITSSFTSGATGTYTNVSCLFYIDVTITLKSTTCK
jgi:hypothetical protein